jgi:hypothetical protein
MRDHQQIGRRKTWFEECTGINTYTGRFLFFMSSLLYQFLVISFQAEDKGEDLCSAPNCSNPRQLKISKDATTGVEKEQLLTLCLSCYNLDQRTATKGERNRKQKRDRYNNNYKLNEENVKKSRERLRARRKTKSEQQANKTLPVLDRLPPKTSKFASEVFAEVCNTRPLPPTTSDTRQSLL